MEIEVTPKKVYKFCSFNNPIDRSLLENLEITFDSPEIWIDFNECEFDFDFGKESEHRKNLEKCLYFEREREPLQFYDKLIKKFIFNDISYHNKETKELINILTDILIKEQNSGDGYQFRFDAVRNNYFKRTGVFCTSIYNDKLPLWMDFANFGEGYCIGLDNEVLHKWSIENSLNYAGKMINYYDISNKPKLRLSCSLNSEDLEAMINVVISLPNKRLWHESEYRYINIFQEELNKECLKRRVKIPKESITDIIIGYKSSIENEKELLSFKNNFISTKFHKTYFTNQFKDEGEIFVVAY